MQQHSQDPSDETLFYTYAQTSDEAAFAEIHRRYEPRIREFLERRLEHTASAEDLTQQVFLRLCRARHTYRPETPFSHWSHTLARNVLMNYLRAHHRRRASALLARTENPEEPPISTDQYAYLLRVREALLSAIRQLDTVGDYDAIAHARWLHIYHMSAPESPIIPDTLHLGMITANEMRHLLNQSVQRIDRVRDPAAN